MSRVLAFLRTAVTDPKSEPAFWIGLGGAIFVLVVQNLVGHGTISSDTGTTVLNLVTALASMVSGLIIRTQVSPAN